MISYYSPRTNRNAILGSGEATSSLTTQEVGNPTILHEVTHQAAFNRGTTAAAAHRRDGSAKDCQPFWNQRSTCSRSYKDRINPRMLEALAEK